MNKRPAIIASIGVSLSTFLVLAVLITAARSQSTPELKQDRRVGPTPQALTPYQKRDSKRAADTVSLRFRERRKGAKLPRSWRFHCSTMQQAVCDSAQTGQAGGTGHPEFQAIYWTDKPEISHPELERIAAYDTRPKEHGGFSADRFSVVVWPTSSPKGYWVGIDLHPNAVAEAWHELKAYVTTCDGPCPKVPVTPACQNVK